MTVHPTIILRKKKKNEILLSAVGSLEALMNI